MHDNPENTLTGTLFAGTFDVVDRIGEGAMGTVYRARHLPSQEWVALKRLHPEHLSDAEVTARFNREMEATANIRHENTVRVIDYGRADGSLYLAMELVKGRSLDDVIVDDAPMPAARAANIGRQIASALAAAHAHNFVHRDLKPENIMLTVHEGSSDHVKVLDFGLAAFVDNPNHSRLTAKGLRVGTPLFMAPEYIEGTSSDHRSDLYALGVVLYMLIVGRAPFLGSGYQLLQRAINDTPIPPSQTPAGCEPWLESIILRLMAKEPGKRIQTAEEVERLLTSGQGVTVVPDDSEEPRRMPSPVLTPARALSEPAHSPPPALPLRAVPVATSPIVSPTNIAIVLCAMLLCLFGFAVGIYVLWPVLVPS